MALCLSAEDARIISAKEPNVGPILMKISEVISRFARMNKKAAYPNDKEVDIQSDQQREMVIEALKQLGYEVEIDPPTGFFGGGLILRW